MPRYVKGYARTPQAHLAQGLDAPIPYVYVFHLSLGLNSLIVLAEWWLLHNDCQLLSSYGSTPGVPIGLMWSTHWASVIFPSALQATHNGFALLCLRLPFTHLASLYVKPVVTACGLRCVRSQAIGLGRGIVANV